MLTNDGPLFAFLLHDIARSMRATFDERARGLGVTRAQWRALLTLARRDGLTQTELADCLEVERISAGRMVDRLVESGMIERRADPSDRRVWRLHLMPAAHEIVSKLTAIGRALEEQMLDVISDEQREALLNILSVVRDNARQLRDTVDRRKEVA